MSEELADRVGIQGRENSPILMLSGTHSSVHIAPATNKSKWTSCISPEISQKSGVFRRERTAYFHLSGVFRREVIGGSVDLPAFPQNAAENLPMGVEKLRPRFCSDDL